jgi:hypothetical protein
MISRRQFLTDAVLATAGVAFTSSATRAAARAQTRPSNIRAFFALNTQDFAYPDLSADLVNRVLDLHESLQILIDVSLTTTMVDLFEAGAPDLLRRLCLSPVVCLAYHDRPPAPYHTNYDWLGMSSLSSQEQQRIIYDYETHGLDLRTGQPTQRSGGYARLASIAGYAPPSVGILVDGRTLQQSADTVFAGLGATFGVVHGRAANFGDRRNGLYVRPEHVDLKLFEHVGEEVRAVVDAAVAEAPSVAGARPPYVVAIKMHDNDFFAEKSAWTTVYLAPGARRGPPWNPDLKADLLSRDDQAAMWTLYESTVRYVADLGPSLPVVNSRDWMTAVAGYARRR